MDIGNIRKNGREVQKCGRGNMGQKDCAVPMSLQAKSKGTRILVSSVILVSLLQACSFYSS